MARFGYRLISALIVLALLLGLFAVPALARDIKKYVNNEFKFSTNFPGNWLSEAKKTKTGGIALVFSGPQGTDEYYTTINLQVVHRQPKETLQSQAQGFAKQLATAPKYKIFSVVEGDLSGQKAVRMVAVYQLPGGEEMFKQDQLIVERGNYFYWIGYTAPENLFEKYKGIMEQAVGSFQFLQ